MGWLILWEIDCISEACFYK